MEGNILDTNFGPIAIIDTFESFIWVDRYNKCGDFELYLSIQNPFIGYLIEDYYLEVKESEHTMIIEDFAIDCDVDEGNFIKITGRSLESILDRRIIWGQTILTGSLQDGILKLLNENAILPVIPERVIPNLIFEASTDPVITALTIDAQFNGENLYSAITKICEVFDIGFKITLTSDNKLKFKLYAGASRSYDQIENPYVEFTPGNDNLLSSNYFRSKQFSKTVSLVAGEGEGAARTTITVADQNGGGSGLNRREMFTDAGHISKTIDGGTLTDEEYATQLEQAGLEDLYSNPYIESFEGQVDTEGMFQYGRDFFMGDIIQIINEYGIESKSRVIEYIMCHNRSGYESYPTLIKVE